MGGFFSNIGRQISQNFNDAVGSTKSFIDRSPNTTMEIANLGAAILDPFTAGLASIGSSAIDNGFGVAPVANNPTPTSNQITNPQQSQSEVAPQVTVDLTETAPQSPEIVYEQSPQNPTLADTATSEKYLVLIVGVGVVLLVTVLALKGN